MYQSVTIDVEPVEQAFPLKLVACSSLFAAAIVACAFVTAPAQGKATLHFSQSAVARPTVANGAATIGLANNARLGASGVHSRQAMPPAAGAVQNSIEPVEMTHGAGAPPTNNGFYNLAMVSMLSIAAIAAALRLSTPSTKNVAMASMSGSKSPLNMPTIAKSGFTPTAGRANLTRCKSAIVVEGSSADLKYCESTMQSIRRTTRTVMVGSVPIGSEHPIALQTMTTTNTRDVEATVAQIIKVADAGCNLVRLTVQGMAEAKACQEIKDSLIAKGYDVPLVADIHFSPKVALKVAEAVDKIRVNPGNFMDGAKKFEDKVYTDEEYEHEIEAIEELFTPLVLKCKELNRAIRIGTNHGSLSARTLGRYGDTADGMVESAFEFARICRKHDFHNFLFSMKASNPLVMVQAYRLLAAEMYKLGWDYPIHLGVTEAGEGEDGRMKSAIGIGALLYDGLGDTIRVSLTEDPEYEIEPCRTLASIGTTAVTENFGVPDFNEQRAWRSFGRREADLPEQREGDSMDYRSLLHRDGSVFAPVSLDRFKNEPQLYADLGCKTAVGMPLKDIATVDSIVLDEVPAADDAASRKILNRLQVAGLGVFASLEALKASPLPNSVALMTVAEWKADAALPEGSERFAIRLDGSESKEDIAALTDSGCVTLFYTPAPGTSYVHACRRLFENLRLAKSKLPVIHTMTFDGVPQEKLVLDAGSAIGALLVDGLGDGVMLTAADMDPDRLRLISFGQLQGCRMRSTKTEFVSCPSCGRTLFDLQEVTAQITKDTGHLPGVAIAVMGCIVNGPGEMADADFGYVGSLPGKIDLYVGRTVVKKNIPMEEGPAQLVQLIKDNGRWKDKEEAEETVAA